MEDNKDMTRRDFLNMMAKGGTAVATFSFVNSVGLNKLFAQTVAEIPVIWLQAGTCTGCSVSVLNSVSPTIQDILLDQVVPGKHLSLVFHATVMAGQGDQAVAVLEEYKKGGKSFVLIVEGSVSTKDHGAYCEVGMKDGKDIPMLDHIKELAPHALAVIGHGTCAAYGGIPMVKPNPTGIKPLNEVFNEYNIKTPLVNVPGCPPHPDWFVATVATILIAPDLKTAVKLLKLDEHARPGVFFSERLHNNCQFRGYFDVGDFAKDFSEKKCLFLLGCKGPVTYSDCPHRRWNNGENWCIGCGSPCIGCVEPGFPFESLYDRLDENDVPAAMAKLTQEKEQGYSASSLLSVGAVGAAAGLVLGAGITTAIKSHKEEKSKEEE